MKSLEIDIETFSSVNLAKAGVYSYTESPDFEVLLFGYSNDGQDVKVVDLANGERIPKEILEALEDEAVTKWAFNAQFERICISKMLGYEAGTYLAPDFWHSGTRLSSSVPAERATHLYRDGVDSIMISKILGHSIIETTKIYALPSMDQMREAMNKVDMPTDAAEKPLWEGDEDEMARLCGLK